MHKALLASVALVAITTQAHADYAWRFVPTKVTALSSWEPNSGPAPGVSHGEAKSWLPEFDIRVTDAAFKSRSLSLSWSGCDGQDMAGQSMCYAGPTGDFSKLVSFDGLWGTQPGSLWGSGDIELSWNKNGKIGGSVEFYGMVRDLTISGSGNKWSGWFAADDSACGMEVARCSVDKGHWLFLGDPHPGDPLPVPEPASFALLAVGLIGAGAVRRFS